MTTRTVPWFLGFALAAVLFAGFLRPSSTPPPSPAEPRSAEPVEIPPDLSSLTPRERFDRLYARVITAAQGGDQATVTRFTPMAIAAYGQLDAADSDARYHLAMLELHLGDVAGAAALADSIARLDPDHLFGPVVAAAAARWSGDVAGRAAAYARFLARYDRALAAGRPEYVEHRVMLEEVKRLADSARGTP